jgi:hypothetical protein
MGFDKEYYVDIGTDMMRKLIDSKLQMIVSKNMTE